MASPLPTMISKRQNYDNSSCLELSIFVTVGIILSSFALPIVLCLAGTIATGACVLNILGNVVVYLTLFGFFLAFQEDHGWQI
ncbi:CLUMA_CG017637, isoform A [Clunio marinus]|uniref:CLUMA_CG017637, isoform A n=2 Tax=Clunio marinus TaxID=568069 RepID=A0A1J1IWU1_9DIPT|nr:CLUMA_CG017637, isoform A [Clunio marinus]